MTRVCCETIYPLMHGTIRPINLPAATPSMIICAAAILVIVSVSESISVEEVMLLSPVSANDLRPASEQTDQPSYCCDHTQPRDGICLLPPLTWGNRGSVC